METLWLLQYRNATAVTKNWNNLDLAIRYISQVLVFLPVGKKCVNKFSCC